MPNHVTNEIIFRGVNAEKQEELLAVLCNAKGHVDFEILVPLPLNMWWGSVGTEHEKAFGRTALDWARENWGTKWNAYSCQPIERTEDTLTLRFDTAWAPPYPWLAAVFNRFQIGFEHNSLVEGAIKARHGVFKWDAMNDIIGEAWQEDDADDALQKRLHLLKWGVESFEDE